MTYGYTRGQLTSISGLVDSITYHPNGQPNVVDRANDTVDVWYPDASNLPRPAKIEGRVGSATGTVQWSTGQYVFDGSGNLVRLGTGYALHDAVSRVKSGAFSLGVTSNGTPTATWSTTYDGFGNIQSIATATSRNTPTSSSTNRLTGSVTYDGAGNMTSWNGASYQYDALDRTWSITNGTTDWRHTYTVDGERVFSYNISGPSRWTLRDLDGKVLREYENASGTWSVVKDYVYRGSHAIAAYTRDASPRNLTHLHTDHLGTVRAVTDANGTRIAYHVFYPFGEEATAISQSTERLKFTGHERDLGNTGSAADDIDYMHARYYNAQIGRFLGVDPGRDWHPKSPQTWNSYGYARNGPLRYLDPRGTTVWVANRPVEPFPAANHAYLIVKPSGSNRALYADRMNDRGLIVLAGGPGPRKVDGHMRMMLTKWDDSASAAERIYEVQPSDQSKEQFERNVIEAFDSYAEDVKYNNLDVGGSNSNALASGVLDAAGAAAAKPTSSELNGWNPGWGDPVELPDATLDDLETEME